MRTKAIIEKKCWNERNEPDTITVVEYRFLGLLLYRKVLIHPHTGEPIIYGF